jgi:hypothetical protein
LFSGFYVLVHCVLFLTKIHHVVFLILGTDLAETQSDSIWVFFLLFSAVQASIAANTWVVSGPSQTKKLQELLPGIINQLGPDNLVNLKKIAQQFQRQQSAGAEDEDDDEVPDLVEGESFEEASKQEVAA